MANQDGLRFLFDIQDKITAKLAKIEAKSKASAAKIDKAFTRASKSQQTNTAKAIAAEQRRIAAVNKAHAAAIAGLKRESEAFKRSMTRMASAATVAFAAVAGKALSMASGYDAAMRSVQAKTGATGAVLDTLSEQAREMGRTTVHSATEAARGQAFLAQAGFEAHEVLAALPGTLALATAGELDLSRAADIASNVLTGFSLNVSEADRVADVLALTAQSTNTNVEQMGDAMKYAAAVAAAADADFEETAAAIGLLANAGFQGETGGTALRGAMSKLLNPTKAAQQILDKLGVSAVTSTGDLKPLHEIIGQFEDAGLTAGDAMKIFGQRAGPGMLALVSQGSDALVELTGELKNAEGTAQKTADIMGGGLWGAIKKIQSIIESAYISLGERFGPAVEGVANLFAKLPAPIQEVIVVLGSLVGAMGGLMILMPQSFGALVQFPAKLIGLAKSLKLVAAAQWLWNAALTANPIGLVVAAVALLAAGLYLLWKRTKSVQETFDASAQSTEDLTARYDDLTDKVAAATAKLERAQKTLARGVPIAAKALRALVAERDELEKHIKQRAKTVEAAKKLAEAEKKAADKKAKAAKKLAAARAKAAKVVAKAAKKAQEATEKSAKAVDALRDSWTGAALKSKEFLRAFRRLTPEQKKNDRIMDQVLDKYSAMRKVLGPFNKELEAQWKATERLNPALAAQRKETEKLEKAAKKLAEKALADLTKEQEKLKKVAEELNERLETQRRRLLGLPTDEAIQSFAELTRTWEGLNEAEKAVATEKYSEALLAAAEAGHELNDAQVELATSAGAQWVESYFDTLSRAFEGGGGFMGGLKSLASNAFGQMFSKIGGGSGGKFTDALSKVFSGDGLLGKIGAAGSKLGGKLGEFLSIGLNAVPVVGPFLAAFAPLMAAGLKKAWKWIWHGMKEWYTFGLIGGASPTEQAGRKSAHEFRQGVIAGLSEGQRAEVQMSWDQGWDSSVIIAVRDALVLTGMEFDAARAAAGRWYDKLHAAEKHGPEAVQRVIDEIQAILDAGTDATEASLAAIEKLRLAAFDAMKARQDAEMAALTTRQQAEMAGITSQIDAIEARLRPKISELDTLIAQQEAELGALATRQDAEMAALATRRQAALDSIMAVQDEQLAMLKETQRKELDDMRAAQEAELGALKAARNAQLSVVEAAIQRELEDERIAAQLKIDLRKAGGDKEAIYAAHARADKSTERLLERDELDDLMAEAEKRVRARYQDELDTINAHWDLKEALTVVRYAMELTALEASHDLELTALGVAQSAELAAHNAYWDTLEALMAGRHAGELTALQSAHTLQLEALLDHLKDKRDALAIDHSLELTALETKHAAELQSLKDHFAAMDAVPSPRDRTVTVTTVNVTETNPNPGGYPGDPRYPGYLPRQHGGPVRSGRSYMVGEGGPEMFVPSQGGRIEPNGSSGGGASAKALGRAVADALEGTEIKVDGRKLGRLTVRHQPLAVAELGGRR